MMKRYNFKKKQLMNLSVLVGLFIVFDKVSVFYLPHKLTKNN
jgi:hypothetical protein